MSLLATTISIALTFGTAAVIDHNKEQNEKHEIVMMVMYDSMMSIEKADSSIRQSMEVQRQMAEDSTQFDKLKFQMAHLMPEAGYTETTEHIFSSSIETINTVGNVLFAESVAEFYQMRQFYKTTICEPVYDEIIQHAPFTTLDGTLNFDYSQYALMSCSILKDMRRQFVQCKQMMKVTDEELEAYREERSQIEKDMSKEDEDTDTIIYEISRHPNYLAEQAIWVSLYIFSIGAGIGIVNRSMIGALLLIVLFMGSTGLAEEISSGKYPEYADYCNKVNKYFP